MVVRNRRSGVRSKRLACEVRGWSAPAPPAPLEEFRELRGHIPRADQRSQAVEIRDRQQNGAAVAKDPMDLLERPAIPTESLDEPQRTSGIERPGRGPRDLSQRLFCPLGTQLDDLMPPVPKRQGERGGVTAERENSQTPRAGLAFQQADPCGHPARTRVTRRLRRGCIAQVKVGHPSERIPPTPSDTKRGRSRERRERTPQGRRDRG